MCYLTLIKQMVWKYLLSQNCFVKGKILKRGVHDRFLLSHFSKYLFIRGRRARQHTITRKHWLALGGESRGDLCILLFAYLCFPKLHCIVQENIFSKESLFASFSLIKTTALKGK